MRFLDLTLPTPAENLALDEALLDAAENGELPGGEVLRLWESPTTIVVVGRASRWQDEVDAATCRDLGVPVLRRASGGAAVVVGAGCLMYAVVLAYDQRPELRILDRAHACVLDKLAAAVRCQLAGVSRRGISDLAWHDTKISGNSVRCKRTHMLYHGTLLYGFDLELVSRLLQTAPRQPSYRRDRTHAEFIANAAVDPAIVRRDLIAEWRACESLESWPVDRTNRLVLERYAVRDWHERL